MPEKVKDTHSSSEVNFALNRRNILLGGASLFALTAAAGPTAQAQQPAATPAATPAGGGKPNILVIFGDDVGYWNISAL